LPESVGPRFIAETRFFAAFFDEIDDVPPQLANVRLAAPRTGDKHHH
jgi:hypothetical protein